jgi:hypothetical protein
MKRGMLGFVPALLVMLAVAAWAQGDKTAPKEGAPAGAPAAPPAASAGPLQSVTSPLGFSISLPSGGTLMTPDSPDWPWASVKEMAYHWMGGGSGVKEILVHVYTFQLPVTQASFKDFTGALLDDFQALDKKDQEEREKDKASQIKQAIGMDKALTHFKFGERNATWDVNGNVWNHLEVKDLRNPKQAVNYSILSSFSGNKVYTVTMIYPTYNDQVKSFAQSVVGSLKVDGALGPLGVEQMISGGSDTLPPGAVIPPAMGHETKQPGGAAHAPAKPGGHG